VVITKPLTISPRRERNLLSGWSGRDGGELFPAARGLCAIPSGSSTLRAGCTLNADSTISYVNPAPTSRSRGPAHRRTRGSRGAYAAPDRFTANQY